MAIQHVPGRHVSANNAAKVIVQTFCAARIQDLNSAIKRVKRTADLVLRYSKLDMTSVLIRVYMDTSFATNENLSSQFGFLVLYCDNDDKFHVVEYKSNNSRRVVRSIMAVEVCGFMDDFYMGFSIAANLDLLLAHKLHVFMYTCSRQLFDAMTKFKHTTELRLMVDILAAR